MMKTLGVAVLTVSVLLPALRGQDLLERVRRMEEAGNARGARSLLERSVRDNDGSTANQLARAEFLDRHGDPEARAAYSRLLPKLSGERRIEVARRLVALDLLADDRDSATRHLAAYRELGGKDIGSGSVPPVTAPNAAEGYIEIPGQLDSFARMAAVSSSLDPSHLLPALARNVVTSGYRVTASYEGLQPTEYMKLLMRYLSQARELEQLAGDGDIIRIEECDSAITGDLLRVLGYRMRGGCGSEVILETVNASRAFLTIDSGFPLAELEQSLRTNNTFTHDFTPSRIPVLYGPDFWVSRKEKKRNPEFIEAFLADPSLCRLYLAMSKLDPPVSQALRSQMSIEKLQAFAHVLDFFGGLFEIRDGAAVVPGGERTASIWAKLVGAPPSRGGEFFERLITTDDGWMASYYDSLRRVNGPVQAYLTEPKRLERFYSAIRGRVTSPGPARPVFRSNADLMLLTTRLWLGDDGKPHLPGDLGVWIRLFVDNPNGGYDGRLKVDAPKWTDSEDVIEALFALSRKPVENEPLKIYMALSNIDRIRSQPLAPATAERLARSWHRYGRQYPIFTEIGSLGDQTILTYLETAAEIDEIGDKLRRADTAGSMQALVGIWQILVRHNLITEENADRTLANIVGEFGRLRADADLFDSTHDSLKQLLVAAGIHDRDSIHLQMLGLLAGTANPNDAETHAEMVGEMRRLFAAQKLFPLDLILDTADHLEALANGAELDSALANRIDRHLEGYIPHREGLSSAERGAISFGYYSERHLQEQRKIRFRTEVTKAGDSRERLRKLRGKLASVLRDTLVGYNYVHYAPPGAQLLQTNPLFVRGHDFLGGAGRDETWEEAEVFGTGWPSSAGGRLVGSLAGLGYALAEAEQNFLIPEREQALIWGDLVPQMMLNAKVPRWWNVSPADLQWAALHMKLTRGAVAESILSDRLRERLLEKLYDLATPARISEVNRHLTAGNVSGALENITPSELYVIGVALRTEGESNGLFARELQRLADSGEVSAETASRAFGTPKPKLSNSYRPELLSLRTFPTLMGYSSRIMAESWESNSLYFALLADELYLRPSQLNLMVPEWTRKTVETIFATHLEDWPAVLRSLRRVGDEVRASMRGPGSAMERAAR